MQTYKYDTHVHTAETSPCARASASQVVYMYKAAGYQGIVITDHYTGSFFKSLRNMSWSEKTDTYLKGYRTAFDEGQKIGLDVILGMELRFDGSFNDYLVYGIDEDFLRNNKELHKYDLQEFRKLASGQNILIYQAHPFRPWITPEDPSLIDGVEVFNGSHLFNSRNHRAYRYAKDYGLKMISGSDFHHLKDFAKGGIIIPEVVNSSEDFVSLLKEDKIIELIGID